MYAFKAVPYILWKQPKHPNSLMKWGTFSGIHGRRKLYHLTNNVTMREDTYMDVLEHHLLRLWPTHECRMVLQLIGQRRCNSGLKRTSLKPVHLNTERFFHVVLLTLAIFLISIRWKTPGTPWTTRCGRRVPKLKITLRNSWVHVSNDYWSNSQFMAIMK